MRMCRLSNFHHLVKNAKYGLFRRFPLDVFCFVYAADDWRSVRGLCLKWSCNGKKKGDSECDSVASLTCLQV